MNKTLAVLLGLTVVIPIAYFDHQWQITKTEVQVLRTAAEKTRADAERVARENAEAIATLEQKHAQTQQEITNAYTRKIATLSANRAADAADIERLRNTIRTYAASGGTPGAGDTAAPGSVSHRLETLAGLLAEGAELVVEGARLVEQRDTEVGALKSVVENDRALITRPGQPIR